MFNSKITSNICSIFFFWSDAKTAQNDSHLIICRLRIFLNLDWSSNNQMKRCRERDGSPVLQIYTCKLMNANTNTESKLFGIYANQISGNIPKRRYMHSRALPVFPKENNWSKFNCSRNLHNQLATWPPPLVHKALIDNSTNIHFKVR